MQKNNRTLYILILIVVGIFCVGVIFIRSSKNNTRAPGDPEDATYIVEGHAVTLAQGVSIKPAAPDSASQIITRYFGDDVTADFDGDGRPDTAFILTQNAGGTGTFYYVVVALNTANGYVGSSGFLIGDRITPQTLEVSSVSSSKTSTSTPGLVINYMDRKAQDSFAIPPSVAKSVYLSLNPQTRELVTAYRP